MKKFKNKKGFTLIELIVVMAVIGILVLLAAPKFLGYTKDANVTAMQSDAKILSNAALMYNIDNEKFPVATWDDDSNATTPEVAKTFTPDTALKAYLDEVAGTTFTGTLAEIDKDEFSSYVKNIKGDYADYVLAISGDFEGEVFHKTGIENKEGILQFGLVEDKTK